MNTLTTKLTAFTAALVMNSLIMDALGFLFEIPSHPNMPVGLIRQGGRRASVVHLGLRVMNRQRLQLRR
jgi:hypothetical protein